MSYPFDETVRPYDGHVYDVPATPGVPVQLDPPGWQWENAGTNGPIPMGAPYTIVETPDMWNYFDSRVWPKSAEQYRGQDRMP